MSINLHTAKKYQVQYTSTIICGYQSQGALDLIFMEFEITTNKDDEYDNEYDLPRSELVRLKDEIVNQTDYFKEREEFLTKELAKIRLTIDEFVSALDNLITTSDQNNDDVLLSWY